MTYLDKSSAELLSDDMREAGGTIDYGMKTDYYQVAIYLPDLETLYNYFPDTYEKLIRNFQDLSEAYKSYLDVNGYENYHSYIVIGSDPPAGKNSPYEQLLVVEIRDGKVGIDAAEDYYG